MKILISGSRNINDPSHLLKAIQDSKFDISAIIHGGAKGVDTLASAYAQASKIPEIVMKPNWKLGRSAGLINNKMMLDNADGVIAIWDGESKGTKHTIDHAKKLGKPVYVHVVKGI